MDRVQMQTGANIQRICRSRFISKIKERFCADGLQSNSSKCRN
jgi:hypothetical protein